MYLRKFLFVLHTFSMYGKEPCGQMTTQLKRGSATRPQGCPSISTSPRPPCIYPSTKIMSTFNFITSFGVGFHIFALCRTLSISLGHLQRAGLFRTQMCFFWIVWIDRRTRMMPSHPFDTFGPEANLADIPILVCGGHTPLISHFTQ
jgi:hypothetical protein